MRKLVIDANEVACELSIVTEIDYLERRNMAVDFTEFGTFGDSV